MNPNSHINRNNQPNQEIQHSDANMQSIQDLKMDSCTGSNERAPNAGCTIREPQRIGLDIYRLRMGKATEDSPGWLAGLTKQTVNHAITATKRLLAKQAAVDHLRVFDRANSMLRITLDSRLERSPR